MLDRLCADKCCWKQKKNTVGFLNSMRCCKLGLSYGAFTLPDSDSVKVTDSNNITVQSFGAIIKIGIASVSVNTPLT